MLRKLVVALFLCMFTFLFVQQSHVSAEMQVAAPHKLIASMIAMSENAPAESVTHEFKILNTGNTGPEGTLSPFFPNVTDLFPVQMYPYNDDIQRYHVALWVSVLLALLILSAVYMLAYMDIKKDTMLYSSFNPTFDRK